MKLTKSRLKQLIKEEMRGPIGLQREPAPAQGSQLKQIIKEELAGMFEDEEVRDEFDPAVYDLEPEAEELGARDPEQDQETMQNIDDMYEELIVDLEDVEDPRMKAKLVKLFQGALESEGEVFELEP